MGLLQGTGNHGGHAIGDQAGGLFEDKPQGFFSTNKLVGPDGTLSFVPTQDFANNKRSATEESPNEKLKPGVTVRFPVHYEKR